MANRVNVELAFTANTEQAKHQLQSLQSQLANLGNLSKIDTSKGLTQDILKASQAAADLKVKLQAATNTETGQLNIGKFAQSLKASGTTLSQYRTQLLNLGPAGQQAFNQLSQSLLSANNQISIGNKMITKFGTTLANTARWQLSSSLLYGFTGAIQEAYQYAQDLNDSLNDIRIVTGYGTDKMSEFAKEANRAAKALSTTTNEYAKASLIYFQQGLSDQEVKARTDITVKMANVTSESAETVSDQMTAVWNNFYDGSKSLEHYADVLTALGAATASSTDEISQGLEKFAAIANSIGLSYEYAASALATVTATTRQSADTVGTAFKTLFARLESLELGETLDDGTSMTKYSQALATVGVSIKDANGQLKDMDTILNELGTRWNTLTRDQQVALAQTVGGMRQYNQLVALMDNWEFFQENLTTSLASTGTLQEQADIYAESWEAASNKVKVAAERIYDSLLDDEFFIDLTEGFAGLIDGIGFIVEGLGGLKAILPGVIALLTQMFSKQISSGLSSFGSMFGARAAGEALRNEVVNQSQLFAGDAAHQNASMAQSQAYENIAQLQKKILAGTKNMTEAELQQSQILLDRQKILNENAIKANQELDIAKEQLAVEQDRLNAIIQQKSNQGAKNKQAAYSGDIKTFRSAELNFGIQQERILTNSDFLQQAATQNGSFSAEYLTNIQSSKAATEEFIQTLNKLQQVNPNLNDEELQQWAAQARKGQLTGKDLNDIIAKISAQSKSAESSLQASTNTLRSMGQALGLTKEQAEQYIVKLRAMIEAEHSATIGTNNMAQGAQQASVAIDAASQRFVKTSERITAATQALSSFAFGLMSIKGIFDTLKNDDMSAFDKITTVLMNVGMAAGMVIPALKSLDTMMYKNIGTQVAETAAQGADIIVNEAHEKSERKLRLEKEKSAGTNSKVAGTQAAESGTQVADMALNSGGKGGKGGISWANVGKGGLAMLAVAAGIAVIVTAYKSLTGWVNRHEEAQKKANEVYTQQKDILTQITNEYENLNSSIDDLSSSYDNLKKMQKGTEEWKDAVAQTNEEALALIDTYAHLGLEYNYDKDGILQIDQDSLEKAKEAKEYELQQAKANTTASQIVRKNAELETSRDDLAKKLNATTGFSESEAILSTMGSMTVGGIGVGAGIGSIFGPLGTVIGGAIGAVGGVIAGGITSAITLAEGASTEAEMEALDKVSQMVADNKELNLQNWSEFNKQLQAEGLDQEMINALWYQKDELAKLVEIEKQSQKELFTLNRTLVQQNNAGKYEGEYSEYVEIFAAGAMTGTYEFPDKEDREQKARDYIEDKFSGTNEDAWEEYLKVMYGEEADQYRITDMGGSGVTLQKLNAEGIYETIGEQDGLDEEVAIEQYAKKKASILTDKDIEEFKKKGQQIEDQLFDIAKISADNISTLGQEIATVLSLGGTGTADLTNLTFDALKNIEAVKNQMTGEEGDVLRRSLEANAKAWQETVAQFRWQSIQDYLNELKEHEVAITASTAESLGQVSQTLYQTQGRVVSEAFNTFSSQMFETFKGKEEEIASILSAVDQNSITYLDDLRIALEDSGFNVKVMGEAWSDFAQVLDEEWLISCENVDAALEKISEKLKTIYDITKDLSFGSIVSDEDLEKLRLAGVSVDNFVKTVEGWKYTGDNGKKLFEQTEEKLYQDTLKVVTNSQNALIAGAEKIGSNLSDLRSIENREDAQNLLARFTGMEDDQLSALFGQDIKDLRQRANSNNENFTEEDLEALQVAFTQAYTNLTAYAKGELTNTTLEAATTFLSTSDTLQELDKRFKGFVADAGIKETSLAYKQLYAEYEKLKELIKQEELKANKASSEFLQEASDRGMESLTAQYEDLADAADRAWGADKLAAMDAQIANLGEQNTYLEQQIALLEQIQALYDSIAFNNAMAELGVNFNWSQVKFDKNTGLMTADTMQALYAAGKAAGLDEAGWGSLTNAVTAAEENSTKIAEMRQQIKDNVQEAADLALEKIEYKLEIKLEINDRELDALERQFGRLEDRAFSGAEKIANLTEKFSTLEERQKAYFDTLHDVTGATINSMEEVVAAVGDLSGKSEKEVELIKEALDGLIESVEDIIEMDKQVADLVLGAFEEVNDEFDKFTSKLERLQGILDNFKNLADVVGIGNFGITTQLLRDINAASAQLANDQLKSDIEKYRVLSERYKEAEENLKQATINNDTTGDYWRQQLEEIETLIADAGANMVESWATVVEKMKEVFESNMETMIKDFETEMTGIYGTFERELEAFDQRKTVSERYVADYERIVELNKLNRKLQAEIDKTDNVKSQKLLRNLQEEIVALQESGAELSKYDLDYLQKKYDLRLAEIALEEAQEAKSQMRLTRNAAGNWVYQYTADDSKVDDAMGNYEDKLLAAQKFNEDYSQEMQEAFLKWQDDFTQGLTELRMADASEEEIAEYEKYMYEQLDYYGVELEKVLTNNAYLYNNEWQTWRVMTKNQIADNIEWQTSFEETILGTIKNGWSDVSSLKEQLLGSAQALSGELKAEYNAYKTTIEETTGHINDALGKVNPGATMGDVLQSWLGEPGAEAGSDSLYGKLNGYEKAFGDLVPKCNQYLKDITDDTSLWIQAVTAHLQAMTDAVEAADAALTGGMDDALNKPSGNEDGGDGKDDDEEKPKDSTGPKVTTEYMAGYYDGNELIILNGNYNSKEELEKELEKRGIKSSDAFFANWLSESGGYLFTSNDAESYKRAHDSIVNQAKYSPTDYSSKDIAVTSSSTIGRGETVSNLQISASGNNGLGYGFLTGYNAGGKNTISYNAETGAFQLGTPVKIPKNSFIRVQGGNGDWYTLTLSNGSNTVSEIDENIARALLGNENVDNLQRGYTLASTSNDYISKTVLEEGENKINQIYTAIDDVASWTEDAGYQLNSGILMSSEAFEQARQTYLEAVSYWTAVKDKAAEINSGADLETANYWLAYLEQEFGNLIPENYTEQLSKDIATVEANTAATQESVVVAEAGAVATGDNTTATGDNTTATGDNTTATGDNTTATGDNTDAISKETRAAILLEGKISSNTEEAEKLATDAQDLAKKTESFEGTLEESNELVIKSNTLVVESNSNLVSSNSTLATAISSAGSSIASAVKSAASSAASAASSAASAASSAASAASSVASETETTTSSEPEKNQTTSTQSEVKSSDDKINGYDKKYLADVAWNRDFSKRAKYNGNIAYWYRDYGVPGYDTGGYTGAWGPEGRLAVLHQKELVLNAADTANFLASMEIMRSIVSQIDLQAMAMASSSGLPTFNFGGSPQTLQQEVHIQAEFPNATNHQEIEEAFGNLVNMATQYANRKI